MPRLSGAANAALYYVPEGYSTTGPQLMGINAASEGQLRAMAMHSGVDRLYAFAETQQSGNAFEAAVRSFNPEMPTEWIPTDAAERLMPIGALLLPGPGLSAYGWMRRRLGGAAFSLCGITHTTATPTVLDALADLWVAPIEPWDAVICPSVAVKAMVGSLLEDQHRYLTERFGPISVAQPQLPVIPLGVDADAFEADPEARAQWRGKLEIAADEVVLLYVGRLNPWTKSHPIPLFLAAAAASRRAKSPLHLILAGWFSHEGLEDAYREAATLICPDLRVTVIDGRSPSVRKSIWQAADLFLSPADNIQETFGLTPVEAMAAGLPVIASDWDGYRDTVRHGIDGFLLRSLTPPSGSSPDIARGYGARTIGYEQYVGMSSQAVAIDIKTMAEAIATLADQPDLRAKMGGEGRRRARSQFDWRIIIARYQELWTELAERRPSIDAATSTADPNPGRPDPFRAFAAYPTAQLHGSTELQVGMTAPGMIQPLYRSPLIAGVQSGLPDISVIEAMLNKVGSGPIRIAALIGENEQAGDWRAIAWLLKYGFIQAR